MAAKTALVLLGDGFEEIEAVCPIDILRRAEVGALRSKLAASSGKGLADPPGWDQAGGWKRGLINGISPPESHIACIRSFLCFHHSMR